MKRVILNIDRLVLRGIPPEQRDALAAGLLEELTRFLFAPGTAERLAGLGDIERLKVGNLNLGEGAQAAEIGSASAQGIQRELLP